MLKKSLGAALVAGIFAAVSAVPSLAADSRGTVKGGSDYEQSMKQHGMSGMSGMSGGMSAGMSGMTSMGDMSGMGGAEKKAKKKKAKKSKKAAKASAM